MVLALGSFDAVQRAVNCPCNINVPTSSLKSYPAHMLPPTVGVVFATGTIFQRLRHASTNSEAVDLEELYRVIQ